MKRKKILFAILFLVSILFFMTGCGWVTISESPQTDTSDSEPYSPSENPAHVDSDSPAATSTNPLMLAELHIADVMNGLGTEKIGEWGYIEILKSDMSTVTGDQITEFCQNKCNGSGLNWIGIIFEDGTGLYIAPDTWVIQMDYGTIDIETATFSDKIGAIIPETWDDGNTPSGYKYVSFEEQSEIQSIIENLLDDEYSRFYSCIVDFMEDASGYSVTLLIDDADSIETLETLINDLGDDRIAEIQITAMQDGKIIATN